MLPLICSSEEAWPLVQSGQVICVDTSYFLPGEGKTPQQSFEEARLPAAVLFDLDKMSCPQSDLPHMVAGAAWFEKAVGNLGIGTDDWLLIYDSQGMRSSPRVWWLFWRLGFNRLSVLNGGLKAWQKAGLPTENGPSVGKNPKPFSVAPYKANRLQTVPKTAIARQHDLLENLITKVSQVVDARSEGRFKGQVAEPRPQCRSGHIPYSINLPFSALLEAQSQTLLPKPQLEQAIRQAGINPSQPLISSCGSGVTACVLALALHHLGYPVPALYDGAWAEWGSHPGLPLN